MSRPSSSSSDLSRLLERQMRNWELARTQSPLPRDSGQPDVAQFVTVANIVGAGGHGFVAELSERLGWPAYHREILSQMAGDDEARARLYKSMDERDLGWLENTVRSLGQQEFRKNDYFHRLTEAILCLARQGPAIFVGRSADLILPQDRGLRVKLIASFERCVQNVARDKSISVAKARDEVDRIEGERQEFIRNHFQFDAYEPTRFDVLVNVERFSMDQAVDLVWTGLKQRGIIK